MSYVPDAAQADLLFESPPAAVAGAVALVFGALEHSNVPPITATLAALLPDMTVSIAANVDSKVSRPTVSQTRTAWQRGDALKAPRTSPYSAPDSAAMINAAAWQQARRAGRATAWAWSNAAHVTGQSRASLFQAARHAPAPPGSMVWQAALHDRRPSTASGFEGARPLRRAASALWEAPFHDRRPHRRTSWQDATPQRLGRQTTWGDGASAFVVLGTAYQNAMRPPAGTSFSVVVVDPDACYLPPPGNAVALLFSEAPNLGALLFWCERHDDPPPPIATVVVPIQRVYIVINSLQLTRVDTGANIPCAGLSLTLDADAWTHTVRARVPGSQLGILEPAAFGQPIELEASINGTAYRWLAESIERERTFGAAWLNVSGRGKAARLEAPYSPTLGFQNANAATMQQLADAALLDNGVPIGWTVDWQALNWSVPAGLWSHRGTRMSALTRLAEAAGATVQSHPSLMTLTMLPRYPTAPWQWGTATPALQLPADVTTRERIVWADKPMVNRVYVSGTQTGGVLGQVTRDGSAGDLLAPMVTDALMAHVDAVRARGLPVLADVGRQARVDLRLPVLPATGIIRPGILLRYTDGPATRTGLVRANSVDAAGLQNTWQTITVETHAP